MTLTLETTRGTLPDRPSYESGRWQWLPDAPGSGVLEIILTTGKREPTARWSRYKVRETGAGVYELVKLDGQAVGEVYEVALGAYPTCTCAAGAHRKLCKHISSLVKLLETHEVT